jgi:hypothetical protein
MQLAGLTAVLQATGELLQQCCMRCQDGSSCAAPNTQCCVTCCAPTALAHTMCYYNSQVLCTGSAERVSCKLSCRQALMPQALHAGASAHHISAAAPCRTLPNTGRHMLTPQRLQVSCPAVEQDTELPSSSGRAHNDSEWPCLCSSSNSSLQEQHHG